MKAILVIDMPESCYYCQFQGMGGRDLELLTCSLNYWRVDNPNERPSWCPLKPMPKKFEAPEIYELWNTDSEYFNGWNACLEALEDSQNGEDSNE